ncbi:MAG: filamentous hemagglutinin family protein [Parvibaculaceae bacterium]|nr:filamentous hemagglutinin family protein [Parvibaculaceae bacterium]
MAANNSLARVTRALQAMQTFQQSQRNLSLGSASTIPPGLAAGGLQVAAGAVPGSSLWRGADAPVQQGGANGTRVDIHQTASQAILNWETFNVSKDTTVVFDQQGQASWVALNRVQDPSGAPSRILGQIRADGSVYLINRNGVVFGGSSQVNTHALVASSADIADAQFLANGIYASQSGASYVAGFTGAVGAVDVEAGAQITTNAPQSVTDGGGFVLLMGSSVHNAGTITTPKGQTQLAAGDDFIIRPGYGTQTNQASTTRGNEIAPVVHAGSGAGSVTNSGLIFAQQGDITLAGHAVEQGGLLLSTTSVNQRGTIHLLNAASDATGSVTVTGEGVSAVLPELESPDTALNSQRDALIAASGSNGLATGQFDNLGTLADRLDEGRIEIVTGGTAEFQTGSLTQAQGGQVAVSAGARIFTRNGATIDVSGVRGVSLAMASNQIEVNIQGNELRDSPANRDAGYLPNQDVWIDARNLVLVPAGTGGYASDRYYTGGGLLEVGGYLSNTAHTIGEWASVGGSITLSAPQVVAQQGSVFNISGGSLAYQGGYIQTSNFLGSDGHLYNVGDAPADMLFYGVGQGFVRRHERWGITEVWMSPLGRGAASIAWQDGYTVGRDAGSLILSTPTSLFEGTIEADVVTGIEQTGARPSGVSDGYRLTQETAPLPGTLALGQYGGFGLIGAQPTDVRFGDIAAVTDGLDLATPLPGDRSGTAWFDADTLNEAHLGGLNIASAQTISVDAPLRLADGAQVTFAAPDITINAGLTAHGGDVTMGNLMHAVLGQGQNEQWWALNNPAGTSQVTINGTVDLTGLWVNGIANPDDLSGVAFLDGGSLTVSATGGITLAGTGAIDVSSGGAILANGKTKGGKGGDVSLITNDYSGFNSLTYLNADVSAPLVLDGAIRAYGFNGGGTLTLGAGQAVVIGDDASLQGGTLAAGTPTGTSTRLANDFIIPAGGTMPIDYQVISTATPVDTPLSVLTVTSVSTNPVITQADWILPPGVTVRANGVYILSGKVPAGSVISDMNTLPIGTVIPSSVFPHGIPTPANVIASYKAGDVVTASVILPVGTVIPVGSVFSSPVDVEPALAINPHLFQSGFTSYDIRSNAGVEISAGTSISPVVPVYRFNAASYGAPGGTSTAEAAELWLPSTYLEDPVAGKLTQRTGADLTLSSLYDFNMQPGSSISADPGHNVTIYANRQTTIDGDITAHGGNILITSLQDPSLGDGRYNSGYGLFSLTRSIWIGDGTALDVSGIAYAAQDIHSRSYGVVQDGGSILLGGTGATDGDGYIIASDAFDIIRPGAVLDASGAPATTLDILNGQAVQPVQGAGDGGTIALYSSSGLYIDGTLRAAAGGAGASGGTLSLNDVNHQFIPLPPAPGAPYGIGIVPDDIKKPRDITIIQDSPGSGLASDLVPGESNPTLQFGNAVIGVNQIHAGGFDSVAFGTRDMIIFRGDADLTVNRSVMFSGGVFVASPDTPDIQVNVAAPYVNLTGWNSTNTVSANYYSGLNDVRVDGATSDDSSFTVAADLVDVSGMVIFGVQSLEGSGFLNLTPLHNQQVPRVFITVPGFNHVFLHSSGDIRLGNGTTTIHKYLTLQADQIYPLSGAAAAINVGTYQPSNGNGVAVYDPDAVLTIIGNGGPAPLVPASVFGSLSLVAPTIDQDGVVRAPLGTIFFNSIQGNVAGVPKTIQTTFQSGSITSTSAGGLIMPFGGTSDGVAYDGIGTLNDLGSTSVNAGGFSRIESGISINGTTVVGEKGAVLDVSGGGDLTGAGFISGRGGSVDILKTPLANANPRYANISSAGDKVYAILPVYASSYAPVIATNDAGDPAIGQQITIPAGVPGLPAGTYTLLPSSYALLPGAYRVELGKTGTNVIPPVGLPNGSIIASGYLGIANTGIADASPTQLILTSGTATRTYSQYNETSFADFATSQAAVFGAVRPRLPEDAGIIEFKLGTSNQGSKPLVFAGTALFNGEGDGIGGALILQPTSGATLDILAPDAAPIAGHSSISSEDINAFNAPTLLIGGTTTYTVGDSSGLGARIYFSGGSTVNVHDGAVLHASQIFLVGSSINIDGGAIIDTRGYENNSVDSTLGYVYGNTSSEISQPQGPAVLAVANGWFNFLPVAGAASINIDSGARLWSDGSIVLAAAGSLTMGDVDLGAKYLTVSQNVINAGTDASLAAAQAAGQLPAGWNLTQNALDVLLHPSSSSGLPALEELTLTTGQLNLIDSVSLDARSQSESASDVRLVLNTPSIYGLGGSGDAASITADMLVWNGVRTGNGSAASPYGSLPPAAVSLNGPGTGAGSLIISAQQIILGYDADHTRSTGGTALDRRVLGFGNVVLSASDRITTNDDSTLSVGKSLDGAGALADGNLTLSTPLLTAVGDAVLAVEAGGTLQVIAPATGLANTSNIGGTGGTISLSGDSVFVDTAVALPSGRLTLNAAGDVTLGDNSVIDLSGRGIAFYDVTKYSWGGDLVLESADGNITQSAGSVIDVSAQNNVAGTISAMAADAANGIVAFDGALKGTATGGYDSGQISITTQSFGDFAALNNKLNDAGFFGARSFDLKQGGLVVGNEVKAHIVTISVDGGSLTVNGAIDASGATPGSITLAARDNLTLSSTAVLDAHSTMLQTDSYGAPVEADNTAHVSLTTASGTLTLSPGATIDMRVTDPANAISYGHLELNAPRTGTASAASATGSDAPANATGDSIAISAAGPLNIEGASSIALSAFAIYRNAPADPDDANGQIIDQNWLDLVDQDSQAFIGNIYGGNVAGGQLTGDLQGRITGLLDARYSSVFHVRPGVEVQSRTPDGNLSTSGDIDLAGYRYGPGADRNAESSSYGAGEPMALTFRAGGDLTVKGSISDGFTPGEARVPATPSVFDGLVDIATNSLFSHGSNPWGPGAGYFDTTQNLYLTEDWTIPNDDFYSSYGGQQSTSGTPYAPGSTIPAGTQLDASWGIAFEDGYPLPGVAMTLVSAGTPASPGMASSTPLHPGSMSASIRLVAGADLAAASSSVLTMQSLLDGNGNLVLSSPSNADANGNPIPSVLRTGTGDLDLLAGGDFRQDSPFGVYTAGTPIAATGTAANALYDPARALMPDGTVLGAANAAYESMFGSQFMYYTEHGGDVLVRAQGDIDGTMPAGADQIGNWLWRQGGDGQPVAWGINFGSYTADVGSHLQFSVFAGIGALGGGNVSLDAGGDIGDAGHGILAAVAGSGRVIGDQLVQTGGGTLSVTAGGSIGTGGNQFVNLRGGTIVQAGSFGTLSPINFGHQQGDPQPLDPLKAYAATAQPGGSFAPGDGSIDLRVRGDLAMGMVQDPGRVGLAQNVATSGGQSVSWFDLWTPQTALDLFSAGGDVSPIDSNVNNEAATLYLPPILRVTASSGNIFLTDAGGGGGSSLMLPSPSGQLDLLAEGMIVHDINTPEIGPLSASMDSLATPFKPGWAVFASPDGLILSSNYWGDPNKDLNKVSDSDSNWKAYSYNYDSFFGYGGLGGNPFVFGPNTVTDASSAANPGVISHIYAVTGDILDLSYGSVFLYRIFNSPGYDNYNFYRAVKPVQIMAGGDVVNLNATILQNDPADVSVIAAGGNIIYAGPNTRRSDGYIYAGIQIAGPGTLEMTAGKNIYQGSTASVESIGALVSGDTRPGASVVMQAGVGAGTPGVGQVDWTDFAKLYLDPANLAGDGPLAGQPGKVAKTYDSELIDWLKSRFGYSGSAQDALAYFLALPAAQQRVFLRQVYYAELTAGGREYNDVNGPRYGSYLRGRNAIAALFPNQDAYQGDITMFSASSGSGANATINSGYVHTDFGGDIQFLAPGGGVTVGTEGLAPGADAGLITQGEGNIQIYSQNSLLLGLSRIMTTFGGDILAWSAEGDINAGRGSKTTVIYTPPKRTYDIYGNVALAPQVPSTGAGIATLNPIPDVPPGDIDLIAPLGTVDAGEAGIRVSGNINIAALHVVNAANIKVQGTSAGIPTAAVPNIGALTTASNAAGAAAAAAGNAGRQANTGQDLPSIITVEVIGYGGGEDTQPQKRNQNNERRSEVSDPYKTASYDTGSAVQILGAGRLDNAESRYLTIEERQKLAGR